MRPQPNYERIFSGAAYAGMRVSTPVPFPDLGITYQPLTIYDELNATPRAISVDIVAGTMAFDYPGVYLLTISGTFEHNSSNQGRITTIRFYNVTLGASAGLSMVIGTGRNAEATPVNYSTIVEVGDAQIGQLFRLEIGGVDTYTSVIWDVLEWNMFSIGEIR